MRLPERCHVRRCQYEWCVAANTSDPRTTQRRRRQLAGRHRSLHPLKHGLTVTARLASCIPLRGSFPNSLGQTIALSSSAVPVWPTTGNAPGAWFALPLEPGFATGILARANGPMASATSSALASTLRLTLRLTRLSRPTRYPPADLVRALQDGTWSNLGTAPNWCPSHWPIPLLCRFDHLDHRYVAVRYGDDPVTPSRSSLPQATVPRFCPPTTHSDTKSHDLLVARARVTVFADSRRGERPPPWLGAALRPLAPTQ